MTKLMQEITKNPGATFEISAELQSGNRIFGTIGPMLNGRLAASINFAQEPSEIDITAARSTMNQLIGEPPKLSAVSDSREEANRIMQKFMGGGDG